MAVPIRLGSVELRAGLYGIVHQAQPSAMGGCQLAFKVVAGC